MCGLLFAKGADTPPHVFTRAVNLMEHRGPDAAGTWQSDDGRVLLGHRRLAIVDLDPRSTQPLHSADGRFTIVFNGEIYNYRELARSRHLTLRTSSDTEMLLELYRLEGEAMLRDLIGMFAFVIYDNETGSYFAARDRLGVKPLYVHRGRGSVFFSSEIAPLLDLVGDGSLDEFGLRQYKKLRTFFNGRTLYNSISMFPAGCYERDGRICRYWELPSGPQEPPTDEELRELVTSAVRYRLVSDVSVGSYLSGGVDSTIVASLSGRPDTWTVGTRENNEFAYARLAAEQIGALHHEVVVDEESFLNVATNLVTVRREPLSVPNEVLLYQMTREVKKRNTVVLSGEGADELFFGYDRIYRWAAGAAVLDLRQFDQLYSYGTHRDDDVLEDAIAPFKDAGSPLDIVARFMQLAHLHGLLRRLDNSTMRCSVEARVPFVDHRLVERLAGVPFAYKMEGGIVKAPLKRVFSDLLPVEVRERPKVGFPVSLNRVFGCEQKRAMDRWLEFNLEVLGVVETA